MRPTPFHTAARTPLARLALALGLLLSACLLALLIGSGTAGASISAKQDALVSVRDQQASISDEIASSNDEINALIGQVSAAREREEAAAAELAAAEAELDAAKDDLAAGREHLRVVRERLRRSIDELERILVGIYKGDDPNMLRLLLDPAQWEDSSVDAAYLGEINDYQAGAVDQVRALRADAADTVDVLTATRDRIQSSRDSIAARRQQLADVRASLQSQEAELSAARDSRKATLSRLAGREVTLQDGIEAIQRRRVQEAAAPVPPPEPEAAPDPAVAAPEPAAPAPAPSGGTSTLNSDGSATPPADAPPQVVAAIEAANQIRDYPYVWGGGHGSFEDSGYDCSGAVSYALNGGGFLSSPLDSTGLSYWGESGEGSWITVYANSGHTYVVIAGLRWDTSGTGGSGPSWSTSLDGYLDPSAYTVRHPAGF